MGEVTGISWSDHTFNPWAGCTKVSPTCDQLLRGDGDQTFPLCELGKRCGTPSDSRINLGKSQEVEQGGARTRARVFVASWSDVMEDRPELQPIREDL